METGEKSRPDRQYHRHDSKEILHVVDNWLIRQGNVKARFLKRYPREIKPSGTANFVFTVKLVVIFVRTSSDPIVSDLDQFLAFTKDHNLLWTSFNTSRHLAVLQARVITKNTFLDNGIESGAVTVSRNTEGAGYHAVTTTNTNLVVVNNRTFRGFGIGINKT